jgi:hypothetical protein
MRFASVTGGRDRVRIKHFAFQVNPLPHLFRDWVPILTSIILLPVLSHCGPAVRRTTNGVPVRRVS